MAVGLLSPMGEEGCGKLIPCSIKTPQKFGIALLNMKINTRILRILRFILFSLFFTLFLKEITPPLGVNEKDKMYYKK